jgi:hypothetical protein
MPVGTATVVDADVAEDVVWPVVEADDEDEDDCF